MSEEKKNYKLNAGDVVFNTFDKFPPPAKEMKKDYCYDCKVELTLENEMVRNGISTYCKKCWNFIPF